ncbi:hypothetical protein [Serinicoccus kebangsaanensis]|uniref:hypothetical protein n=1 Tax=Serinicoccus kebangsaanensis TaxID=2602069 RepID=UPI00124D7B1A|nr:hypothetical protein [Serinicoccus kebangsaanensis]
MDFYEAVALIALAGVVLLVLAGVGLVGQMGQLRREVARLQRAVSVGGDRDLAADVLRPSMPARVSAILVTSPGCESCEAVLPTFLRCATGLPATVRAVVLSWDDTPSGVPQDSDVDVVLDTSAFRSVEPGWTPALVLVEQTGSIVGVEPVGSPEVLADVMAQLTADLAREGA